MLRTESAGALVEWSCPWAWPGPSTKPAQAASSLVAVSVSLSATDSDLLPRIDVLFVSPNFVFCKSRWCPLPALSCVGLTICSILFLSYYMIYALHSVAVLFLIGQCSRITSLLFSSMFRSSSFRISLIIGMEMTRHSFLGGHS